MFLEVGFSLAPLSSYPFPRASRTPRFSFLAILLFLATFVLSAQLTWASTTTTLALSSGGNAVSQVSSGSAVTLTASVVAGGSPVTRGQVNFCDAGATYCADIHIVGSAQLTSAGTAVYRFVPGIGTHSYKAVFAGTNSNTSSSSIAQSLVVTGQVSTSTYVSSMGTPGNYTLYATVQTASSANVPTGTASFIDISNNNVSLGSGPLVPSQTFDGFIEGKSPPALAVSVAAGDFNGDGKIDVLTTDPLGNLTVALGAGDGTFSATVGAKFDATVLGGRVVLGDFNGDGIADVASLGTANQLGIFLGNGDGSFTAAAEPATGMQPGYIAVGDWNGDGTLDIAVANVASSNMTIMLGNGDGTFQVVTSEFPTAPSPTSIASADFNGDGILDLAVLTSDTTVTIFTGNGDGTFTNSRQVITGTSLLSITVGDFNGDGKPDLAVGALNSGSGSLGILLIYLNKGDGSFDTTPDSQANANNGPGMMLVRDFDGDGNADILIAADPIFNPYIPEMVVVFGDGKGTFGAAGAFFVTNEAVSVASADFDGDGYPDTLSVDAFGNDGATPSIFYSRLTHSLTAVLDSVSISGIGPHLVEASYAGDANFAGSTSDPITLIAKTVAPTLTLTAMPTASIYGQQVMLTAALTPYSDASQTGQGETITFYQGTSSLGSATIGSAVGTAILNVTALPAGVDALTAVFSGDTNFLAATSAPVSITVAQALPILSWYPQEITYGTPLSSTSLNATASVPGTLVYTPAAGTVLSAGSQTLSVAFTPSDTQDYKTATATTPLTVSPAPLTITANNATRAYGAANPPLSAVVSGAVNNDVLTATASTTATTTSQAGTYPIVPAVTGPALPNYTVQAVNGTLTVTKVPTTVALTASAAANVAGASVSFTATLASATGTPTGSVSFMNGANLLGTVALTGLTATYSTTALPLGADSITAVYSGDADFVGSTSNGLTETVTKVPTTAALTASAATTVSGMSVNFTATVASTTGTPTGSFMFMNGTALLGTIPLTGLTATYSTAALPIGANNITAVYSGDANFAMSTSPVLIETVTGVPDFSLTANPATLTIKQGQSAATTITLTPVNGYSQTVSLACGTLPSLVTCTFAPSSLTPNGSPVTTQLTITTMAPTTAMLRAPSIERGWPRSGAMPISAALLLCLLPFAGRRRLRSLPLFVLLAVLVLLPLSGCGGAGSSSAPPSPGTPIGTSQITITAATSSDTSHVVPLSVTVTE